MLKNRLDLRPEDQALLGLGVIKRLDSQTITRHEQLPLASVPDGKPEHASELVHAVLTKLLIQMDDDFAIAGRGEPVTLLLETVRQLAVVIDLTVGHQENGMVLVGQGLLAAHRVNDAQTAHPERRI